MKHRIILAAFVLVTASVSPLRAEPMNEIFAAKVSPPFSGIVLVAKGEKVVFKHSDTLEQDGDKPVITPDTRFMVGSISKQVTATLVLRAVQDGKLVLESPLAEYMPNSGLPEGVTLGRLLNHTSGLAKNKAELNRKPGDGFVYSNAGYNLLGELLVKINGQSYGAQANSLFAHCGMTRSLMPEQGQHYGDYVTTGYHEDNEGRLNAMAYDFPFQSRPSGGLISTATDLVKWNRCLHRGRLLDEQHHARMVKATVQREHRWGNIGYGFGLQRVDKQGLLEWNHSGYVPGAVSLLSYFPASDTSVVVLENISRNPRDLARAFYFSDRLRAQIRATQTLD